MFGVGLKPVRMSVWARTAVRSQSTVASTRPTMTWVEFFKLKKQNSRINMAALGVTGLLGCFATLTAVGNVEIDIEKPIMGLDPTIVLGGLVVMGGALGWVLGPFLGTAIFNLTHKLVLTQFKQKDRIFFNHIKVRRVDPSSQSFSNPVPDYYGEKIYLLADYKQWLRDCNAFRRKAKEFL